MCGRAVRVWWHPGTQACPAGLAVTGVGVSYSGFASGSKLTTQVCIKSVCHLSAPTKVDSKAWVSVVLTPVLKGAQVVFVTVHDAANRVVAQDKTVSVHRLRVTSGDCPEFG